ncbi:MAG: alpha/beta fold hydrolase [Pseudomonadota bacterium]
MLTTVIHGAPTDAPPLLIAHGLFGSARNWGVIAKRLSDSRQVIAVDMRNHGASPWAASHSYSDLAQDLAEVIAAHGGVCDVLGHSMGGKAAMVLALSQPALIRRLIVADIAPVAYGHSQRHLIAAMRAVDLSTIRLRSDADVQLQAHVADATTRAFLLQSLDTKGPNWTLNLDVLDAEMDDITGWPVDLQGLNDGPTLFLLGAESDYMTDTGRKAARTYFPKARFAKITGAGHWLHAEKPREFEASVRVFLNASS